MGELNLVPFPSERACTKCGEIKSLATEFYKDKRRKYGRYSQCKKCTDKHNAYMSRKTKNKAWRRAHHASFGPQSEYYRKMKWNQSKRNAKAKGVPFNIEVSDIIIPEYCPALGIKLELLSGRIHNGSPSVDRIKPELGYVKGNIIVVSMLANQIKTSATVEQMQAVTNFYSRLTAKGCPEIEP